jgi:hypothetical protein
VIDQVDKCKYLFLREILEPEENSLLLLIDEARASDTPEDLEIGDVTIQDTRRVEHDASCRVFELKWGSYISYSVTNESYANADDPQTYTGSRVRRYFTSAFLEYVRQTTFATKEYPGPFQHVAIICENHVVDIASVEEPQVRLAKPGRPRPVGDA